MRETKTELASQVDGLILKGILVEPEGRPKGIMQICHGMTEHKERYLPFMHYLADQGFASFIYDHRGHGESIREEADLGYIGKDGGNALVEDAHLWTMFLREKFGSLPLTLMGHSMGSLIVRCYVQKYDKDIDALVVMGSVSANPLAGIALGLVAIGRLFHGERFRSKFISGLAFGPYLAKLPNVKTSFDWLCADEAVVAAYIANPLCGFTFTLNGYKALFSLLRRAYQKKAYGVSNPSLPIHFTSGEADPCMGNRKSFDSAVRFMKGVGYGNVSFALWPGMRHEVLNEQGKEKVYEDIAAHCKAEK